MRPQQPSENRQRYHRRRRRRSPNARIASASGPGLVVALFAASAAATSAAAPGALLGRAPTVRSAAGKAFRRGGRIRVPEAPGSAARRSFVGTRAASSVAVAPAPIGESATPSRIAMTPHQPQTRPPASSSAPSAAKGSSGSAPTEKAKKAKLVSAAPESLALAGRRLRSGELVSFPTETVYGLGCHALDPDAVAKVFEAKERPLSDPLIVHVCDAREALDLWDASSSGDDGDGEGDDGREDDATARGRNRIEASALRALASRFWPGPLTLVARSTPAVPPLVTAGTGYVACRSPSHPVARSLIAASGVPVAAPSANKFGHVSPTRARHVMEDLGAEDVWIVDPGSDGDGTEEGTPREEEEAVCAVGVESTVAKIEFAPSSDASSSSSSHPRGRITVLRHGAISSSDVRSCLASVDLARHFDVRDVVRATKEDEVNVAPGQTIRHYSPDVVSYMISRERYSSASEGLGTLTGEEKAALASAVVVDYGAKLSSLKNDALAYRDLSPDDDSKEAAASVFETLRWAENVAGAERVYFPEIIVATSPQVEPKEEVSVDALALAVKDRLTRAASGIVVDTLR